MSTKTLSELAKTIRSKNAGVNKITFDIIFRDRENYERVRRSRVLTRDSVAALYRIPLERICDFGGSLPPRNPSTRIVPPGPAISLSTFSISSGSSGSPWSFA